MGDEPLKDARQAAKGVLERGPMDSVATAFKFMGGGAVVFSGVGGAIHILGGFTLEVFLWLSFTAVLLWLSCYVVQELIRLSETKQALRAMVDTERNYELLLTDVRKERDGVNQKLVELQAETKIMQTAQGLGLMLNRVAQQIQDAQTKDQDHE